MSQIVFVQEGESLWDICLNATGTLANLDLILDANGFDTWTPVLAGGQAIIIPDTVTNDNNTLRELQTYPLCNNANTDTAAKIAVIFDILGNNWILANGFWNDDAIWIDTKTWIDAL